MLAVEEILKRYCTSETVRILMVHGRMVAGKALEACSAVNADSETRRLVIEAAYLHDIGVCKVAAPDINCFGTEPYIRHGVLGTADLSLRIEQGHEVRRPSIVQLRARLADGSPLIQVGGGVVPVVRGELV